MGIKETKCADCCGCACVGVCVRPCVCELNIEIKSRQYLTRTKSKNTTLQCQKQGSRVAKFDKGGCKKKAEKKLKNVANFWQLFARQQKERGRAFRRAAKYMPKNGMPKINMATKCAIWSCESRRSTVEECRGGGSSGGVVWCAPPPEKQRLHMQHTYLRYNYFVRAYRAQLSRAGKIAKNQRQCLGERLPEMPKKTVWYSIAE